MASDLAQDPAFNEGNIDLEDSKLMPAVDPDNMTSENASTAQEPPMFGDAIMAEDAIPVTAPPVARLTPAPVPSKQAPELIAADNLPGAFFFLTLTYNNNAAAKYQAIAYDPDFTSADTPDTLKARYIAEGLPYFELFTDRNPDKTTTVDWQKPKGQSAFFSKWLPAPHHE